MRTQLAARPQKPDAERFFLPMVADPLRRVRSLGRRLTRLDRAALAGAVLYALVWLVRAFRPEFLAEGFFGFLVFFLGFLSLAYFLVRLLGWARARLLWSLRNRLIVAYVFIAVVPVLLLLVMAALSAYLVYWQLGAYLLYDDVEKRIERVAGTADALATSLAAETAGASARLTPTGVSLRVEALLAKTQKELPGLQVELNTGQELLWTHGGPQSERFAGITQSGDKLWLRAVVARSTPSGRLLVSVSAPVTSELADTLAPEMGPLQLTLYRPANNSDPESRVLPIGNRRFVRVGQIPTRRRALPPPLYRFDYEISGASKMEAVQSDPHAENATAPVVVFFSTRPSLLNRRLFSSLGEFGGSLVSVLTAVGIIFLVLEVAALVTGVVLTQTITRAVADLYGATQYVQTGDLSHRIRIQRKDQLGALAESFNSMTSSISGLIEEQRQRQRLENELSIAREVQAQLFPQKLPSLPGIQVQAICRAARMVSGDYYDFIPLGPTRLGIALADISGKGISAALLMASLQAALRSQVLLDGRASENTADVVTRVNRHLFLSTSADRYATFFYAVYDAPTRTLRYTNAGHLPPLCIFGDRIRKLEDGGTVVGLFDDGVYEQGTLQVEPGSLLLAYSDGLIEPENVYGEQFGNQRLADLALRYATAPPQAVIDALMAAADEWAGSPEQADDMTVIVARLE